MSKGELTTEEKIVLEFIKELHAKNKRIKVLDLIKHIEKGTEFEKMEIMEAIKGLEMKGFIKLTERHHIRAEEEVKYPKEIIQLKAKIERLKELIIKVT